MAFLKQAFLLLTGITAVTMRAQTFTVLQSFDRTNGAYPVPGLTQGTDGKLYGATFGGGTGYFGPDGTVYTISPNDMVATLYAFCPVASCPDGQNPLAGLIQATDGNFYGGTSGSGITAEGTLFEMTSAGILTTLYNFCSDGCQDGLGPTGLIQGYDGNLYGTTEFDGGTGHGTIFKITPAGALTTLYNFCSQSGCTDGAYPRSGLIQGFDGTFYGVAREGGAGGVGTVFRITPDGFLTTLYDFCARASCSDGSFPEAALVESSDGDFYGTTSYGGIPECNGNGCGTVFKITASGVLTTLHRFCSHAACADGAYSEAGLIQGSDGNFYGSTGNGGAYGRHGTIYSITPAGELTTLYSFCETSGCPDGEYPYIGVAQSTNGKLYGATSEGGASGVGTIFSLSTGLPPFVEMQPPYGKVASTVKILGSDLTGATGVTFNGVSAPFKVISPYLILATVPSSATTGSVAVATPGGALQSNVPFRLLP